MEKPGRGSRRSERGRIFPAKAVRRMRMAKVPKRWFEDFFGSDYLIRYVHPETPAQVGGIARALRPRGKFLMELFNRDSLVGRMPSQSWQARDDGTVVLEDASFDLLRGRFETRQVIIDRKGTREFTASVRAYTLAELREMLDAAGLFVHRVLGGLDLSPYTARSWRMVLYAVKGLEPEGIRTMW